MHTRMLEAAESLSQEEIRAVMHFLMRMREAVDAVNSASPATVR
jgi:hypothetical protein